MIPKAIIRTFNIMHRCIIFVPVDGKWSEVRIHDGKDMLVGSGIAILVEFITLQKKVLKSLHIIVCTLLNG